MVSDIIMKNMENKKSSSKLLWMSDSPLTVTGFATISWNILNQLSDKGYECHYLGHNYVGQEIPAGLKLKDDTIYNFNIHGGSSKPYAQDILMPKIQQLKPDVFGILLDTFMLYPWMLNLDFAPAKTIFYFPSDGGGGLPINCENILKKVTCPVAMSKFAQKQAFDLYGIQSEYIPHAINEKIYYPLSDEEKLKLRQDWNLVDKYVVGCVARNQGRKMLDRMIKAFKIFAKDVPNAVLFLHMDPFDLAAPFDIMNLIQRAGLQNRVLFTGMKFFEGFDYKKMNEIYNMMDVFFLSTSGEGFGVPIIEAMACEIPVVVTDYTTTQELIIDDGVCGIPVPIHGEITGSWNVERGIMNEHKAAEALKKLYDEPEFGKQLGKVGREKVLKIYTWDIVGEQWNRLIERLSDD